MRGVLFPAFVSVAFLSACISVPSPYETTTETQSIVEGNTEFGLDLYDLVAAETDENIFISPASISTALAMTYGGARGTTATEISEALHFALPVESFHKTMAEVLAGVQRDEEGRTIAINNRIFVDRRVVTPPTFSSLMSDTYNAPQQRVDFRNQPGAAREMINTWVEDKTEDRITDLLAPDNVSNCTRMVLVNTIYLDADWANPFEMNDTEEDTFTTLSGNDVTLPMMGQLSEFRHIETADFQAVELPYQGDDLSLIVFLPEAAGQLSSFERNLAPGRLNNWMNRLATADPVRVDLKLPKIELRQSLGLKQSLQSLGMAIPFSDSADFTGIAAPADNQGDPCWDPMLLKVDDVVHKTFLKIDEEGTEAAAATAVVLVEISSGRIYAKPPIIFHADRPFFFVIKDNTTGLVLFMGRFTAPA